MGMSAKLCSDYRATHALLDSSIVEKQYKSRLLIRYNT